MCTRSVVRAAGPQASEEDQSREVLVYEGVLCQVARILVSDWLSEEEDQSREVLVYEGVLCQVARILASDWLSEASTLCTCSVVGGGRSREVLVYEGVTWCMHH